MKRISIILAAWLALAVPAFAQVNLDQVLPPVGVTVGNPFTRPLTFTGQEPTPPAPTATLVATSSGNCTAGAHLFKITLITVNETDASVASGSVTCDGTHKQVTLALPFESYQANVLVTGENVYATKAGGSTYFLVASSPVIGNNTTLSYTFNIADASFTATTAPSANSTIDTRLNFSGSIFSGSIVATADNPIETHTAFATGATLYTHSNTSFRGPVIGLYRSGGTQTAPLAISNGFTVGYFPFKAYNSGDGVYGNVMQFEARATGDWTVAGIRTGYLQVYNGANQLYYTLCDGSSVVLVGGSQSSCAAALAKSFYLTVQNGPLSVSRSGLTNGSSDGTVLESDDVTTSGVTVHYSPRVRLRSRAWDTAADETLDWTIENVPTSAGTPTSVLKFGHSLNGAGYTFPATLSSAGLLTTLGGFLNGSSISVSSGFGSGASFATGSNPGAFDLAVGTTPGSSGVITLPAAPHGWTCWVDDKNTIADRTYTSAYSTVSATFTTTIGWTNNDHLYGGCNPF